jgi:hypothetical protein
MKKYGYKDIETGWEFACLHVLAQQNPFAMSILHGRPTNEADLSDHYTGGSGDMEIDALIYDEGNQVVEIIQSKWTDKKDSVNANDAKDARNFFRRIPEWRDPELREDSGSERIREKLEDIDWESDELQIRLTLVKSKILGQDQSLQKIADQAAEEYERQNLRVTCTVLGATELLELDATLKQAASNGLVQEIKFDVPVDTSFVFEPEHGLRVLTAVVKGNQLANIYKQKDVGPLLFNSNIRLALSSKTSINAGMKKTLEDPNNAKNFFYYNNGVTATCSEFDFDEKKGTVKAKNLQIINGAQTVSSLGAVLAKQPNNQVFVLLRLIETLEGGKRKSQLADNITRFQNTQNPVRISDFLSNDPFQLWLRDNLAAKLSGKGPCISFNYIHKRGDKPSGTGRKRSIGLEELGMLRYAFLHSPCLTYDKPKELWDPGRRMYWKAFGRDGEECSYWTEQELAEVAWMITALYDVESEHKKLSDLKRKNSDGNYTDVSFLKYLARYIVSLSGHALRSEQRSGRVPNFEILMSTDGMYHRYTDPVIKSSRRIVRQQLALLREGSANPRLNYARKEEYWLTSLKSLVDELENEQVFVE